MNSTDAPPVPPETALRVISDHTRVVLVVGSQPIGLTPRVAREVARALRDHAERVEATRLRAFAAKLQPETA